MRVSNHTKPYLPKLFAVEVGANVGLGLKPVIVISVGGVDAGSTSASAELNPEALYSVAWVVMASVIAPLLTASIN
jgi:hypothetical protein